MTAAKCAQIDYEIGCFYVAKYRLYACNSENSSSSSSRRISQLQSDRNLGAFSNWFQSNYIVSASVLQCIIRADVQKILPAFIWVLVSNLAIRIGILAQFNHFKDWKIFWAMSICCRCNGELFTFFGCTNSVQIMTNCSENVLMYYSMSDTTDGAHTKPQKFYSLQRNSSKSVFRNDECIA